MNNNYKILISVGIVTVIAFSGFQINKTVIANKQSSKIEANKMSPEAKEQSYRNAILSLVVKDGKLAEDEIIFESLGDYLDSPYLLQYVKALEETNKSQPNYSLALDYLDKIPDDFNSESTFNLSQVASSLRRDIEDKQEKLDLHNLISSKGYVIKDLPEYMGIKANDIEYYCMKILKDNNINYKFLYDSASQLITFPDNVVIDFRSNKAYIFQIQDNDGKVINSSTVLADYAWGQSNKEYRLHEKESQKEEDEMKKQRTVSLGMTSNKVINAWGKPDHINRTITENGVSEQWVYGTGRYVYLDDGIVTAIQD